MLNQLLQARPSGSVLWLLSLFQDKESNADLRHSKNGTYLS
jgi:hypothetical protein